MRARAILSVAVAAIAGGIAAQSASAAEIYVATRGSDDVTIVDTVTGATQTVGFPSGSNPEDIAITPDGSRAYVAASQGTVHVIDTQTKALVGQPIPVGFPLQSIAISPDGTRVYVVRAGDPGTLVAIDAATNAVAGPGIEIGRQPNRFAITPDGTRAYVGNSVAAAGQPDVTLVDLVADTASPTTIDANTARGVSVKPDGTQAYVVSNSTGRVSVIDVTTNSAVGPSMPGANHSMAITPDGTRGIGTLSGTTDNVQAFDLVTNQPVGSRVTVQGDLDRLAIEPGGPTAWLAVDPGAGAPGNITPIDPATLAPAGPPLPVGADPRGLAIVPNQSPEPVIAATIKGRKVEVDAGDSRDESLATNAVAWTFGDGATAETRKASHTYAEPGRHTVALTLDDGQGCPGFVFTGQTAMCNGPSTTTAEALVASIKLGKLKRNRARGTAKLKVKAPGPGKLKLSGNGVRKASAEVTAGKGGARLSVKARGGKRRKLERSGKAKLKLKVAYRPEGGLPNQVKKRAKLVLR